MGIHVMTPYFEQVIKPKLALLIGAPAIDRTYAFNNAVYRQCYIEGHPALKAGTVTKIRLWLKGTYSHGYQIGTLYKTNGNTFSSRYWGTILPPIQGFNEYTVWQVEGVGATVSISIPVEIGDYIGIRMYEAPTGNGIAGDITGGLGWWYTGSEDVDFPFTDKTFNYIANWIMSLNGWG